MTIIVRMYEAHRRWFPSLLVALAVAALVAPTSAQSPAPAAPATAPVNADDADVKPGTPGKDVIFLPTPPEVVSAMLDLAKVTKDDVVYDLGSGDGRTPITAAKEHGARGVGVEFNPKLVALSRQNAETGGRRGPRSIHQCGFVRDGFVRSIRGDAVPSRVTQSEAHAEAAT